ncbi:hypothetical protein [Neorhodopirellula pilleata]|uniref:Uncharacterized protein n=1 Tax=Neorhodopirellula pilleata TaxID=2714738 RepID=A0A5C6AQH8_9BACT|nr:hypothetical protein [Neorhodopirellula pilleata]TWU01479.1 hypothetical protein Pla100_12140 [Neorhodopirellula pilleata]
MNKTSTDRSRHSKLPYVLLLAILVPLPLLAIDQDDSAPAETVVVEPSIASNNEALGSPEAAMTSEVGAAPEASTVLPESAPETSDVAEALDEIEERPEDPAPFDFSPYRVLIWIASDNPRINAASIEDRLLDYLDRDFFSIWRTAIADAPPAVATVAQRDLAALNFDVIAASDPVIAIKRTHKDSIRIHFAADAGRFLKQIQGTKGRVSDIIRRIEADPEYETTPAKFAWKEKLVAIDGDAVAVQELWKDEATEAVLVSRGMAETFDDPSAKMIVPPVEGQVVEAIEGFDKIYFVRLQTRQSPMSVQVSELDTLMRHFGSLTTMTLGVQSQLPEVIGAAVRETFSPVVRIDDAGQKDATGLVRASGLALDPDSPAHVRVGDILEPMVRKDDRNGKPMTIGPLDWAYLLTKEVDGHKVKMDFHAGRMGGLQGRKNNRTHRMGIVSRPSRDDTTLRLHAKGKPDLPLIGYEIYDKDLEGTNMTFVGRTNWNGVMEVDKIETPLRLLYVKNGGAVLARLPIVPGHHPTAVADLEGDDMRLQAESYIRGVQNVIIDLVAIRELFKARIMLRLKKGELKEADELLEALRNEPSNERIANDMGKKQTEFLKAIGRNANQQRKVDEMFSTTRKLLSQHINPKLVNDLEEAMIQAKANGGKLPAEEE